MDIKVSYILCEGSHSADKLTALVLETENLRVFSK